MKTLTLGNSRMDNVYLNTMTTAQKKRTTPQKSVIASHQHPVLQTTMEINYVIIVETNWLLTLVLIKKNIIARKMTI